MIKLKLWKQLFSLVDCGRQLHTFHLKEDKHKKIENIIKKQIVLMR